jgi:hypothetical protein
MLWPQVARRYLEIFSQASLGRRRQNRAADLTLRAVRPEIVAPGPPPEVHLNHLLRLTDDVGIFQHAIFHLPNYAEGYTTDDNARALLLSLRLYVQHDSEAQRLEELLSRYLAFLWYAYNPVLKRFRNFLGYDRRWLEDKGSDDSQGRAIWALGEAVEHIHLLDFSDVAFSLFQNGLPAVLDISSPRAWAFTLLGIHPYLQRFPNDRAVRLVGLTFAERLAALYRRNSATNWPWFEEAVAYSNARLPQALLVASQLTGREEYGRIGFESLEWLVNLQTSEEGHFMPVGSNGFYRRGGERALFDQQPVEAGGMVSACLEAYSISQDAFWLEEARRAYSWFFGANIVGLPLYDPGTGGCHDGLQPDRLNRNQGAESTLSLLRAWSEMRSMDQADRIGATEPVGLGKWSIPDKYPSLRISRHAARGNGHAHGW